MTLMEHRNRINWETATDPGRRRINADALAVRPGWDSMTPVLALADGVGDTRTAADAARVAVDAATSTVPARGPTEAILAAQRAVLALSHLGDSVLVVAMPFADQLGNGYRIGWVGDARAYRWDGRTLTRLTTDHTVAEYFRRQGLDTTPWMEHMVTATVRSARPQDIGQVEVRGDVGLLLCSDGVYGALDLPTMTAIVARPARFGPRAQELVATAIDRGATDNATALLLTP
ncbi:MULTISPECIES: PP2C family serine/threonine-protein phosphatase [unclassified Crossiella]|uniref:PP2C family protein-serine/threonine phosphatase n=1 Tax=unclassified Crossiella TaxID=2620835 RepID=UPI001FFEA201|nr:MULTISPECIES: serine/threonine protein phosphatase [unclassified Crossiella]MCK2244674.1 serine/threonine protein phosphatase [Crossiella sp. S99.2]MCK2258339.1 serine/threonine protein phosphatase [Crossiella sp. S99.1]